MTFGTGGWALAVFLATATVPVRGWVPACPEKESIIGPVPPRYPIRPDPFIDFDDDELGLESISGHLRLIDVALERLRTIDGSFEPDCDSSYPQITGTFDIQADVLQLDGDYEIEALVDSPYLLIEGTGHLSFHAKQLQLHFVVEGMHDNATDKLKGEGAEIDLELEELSFHMDGLRVCELDWKEINLTGKPVFDIIWSMSKGQVDELLSGIVEELFNECTLTQLLQGETECMSFGPWEAQVFQLLTTVIRQAQPMSILMQMIEDICETPSTRAPTTARSTSISTTPTPSSAMRIGHGWWATTLNLMAVFPIHYVFSASH